MDVPSSPVVFRSYRAGGVNLGNGHSLGPRYQHHDRRNNDEFDKRHDHERRDEDPCPDRLFRFEPHVEIDDRGHRGEQTEPHTKKHVAVFGLRHDQPFLKPLWTGSSMCASTDRQVVRVVGLEPTLCCQNWILNPARLPIPPHPHKCRRRIRFLTLARLPIPPRGRRNLCDHSHGRGAVNSGAPRASLR